MLKTLELHELEPCIICEVRLCYEKGYGPEFGLCSTCAREVFELYYVTHGGERFQDRQEKRPKVSQDVRWKIFRDAGFSCQVCRCTDRPLHLDHIIPLALGGANEASNFQCLCDKCNLAKGARV